jgi:hypothetical protein
LVTFIFPIDDRRALVNGKRCDEFCEKRKRSLLDGPVNNFWNPEVESNDPIHFNAVPVRI